MTHIAVDSLTKKYGDLVAVNDVSFEVGGEEFLSIVGPSGCGKTTTLRCIAGLEQPTAGEIRFDGVDLTDVPVHRRNLAMMFQSISLYPHMTLRENIGYPLKVKGVSESERNEQIEAAAEIMQIGESLEKYPGNLSGGQQQRVALARTVVGDPVAFLMDEPLSDLDAKLKVEIRKEIQRIHKRIGEPAVYVTHDQEEAMTMSDRIAIMNDGELEQIGDVEEVYQYPENMFVAKFIGNPSMNFFSGTLSDIGSERAAIDIGGQEIEFAVDRVVGGNSRAEATLGVRPPDVIVSTGDSGHISGELQLLEPLGDRALATIEGPQGELSALVPASNSFTEGDQVSIDFEESELYLFDPDTTDLLARSE